MRGLHPEVQCEFRAEIIKRRQSSVFGADKRDRKIESAPVIALTRQTLQITGLTGEKKWIKCYVRKQIAECKILRKTSAP